MTGKYVENNQKHVYIYLRLCSYTILIYYFLKIIWLQISIFEEKISCTKNNFFSLSVCVIYLADYMLSVLYSQHIHLYF